MGSPPMMARPPQQGHSPLAWLGISIVLLVVIFGGLATAAALLTHQVTTTKTFSVGNQPKLVVTSDAGYVHIVSGPAGQITVVARQHIFWGNNNQLPIRYEQSSDRNMVTVSVEQEMTFGFFSLNFREGIDFDVTVPSQTALNIHTHSGDITSSGITGQMTLGSDSGSITTDNGSGQVTLTTDSGSIHASNISGQMTLTTDSGSITVSNASASGSSTFHTDSGSITYEGTLAPNGTYDFMTDSGSIDVTLPGSAAFHVQANTDSGSIDSAFSEVTVLRGDSQGLASGTAGSAPYAQITIETDSGDIRLHKA